MGLEQYLVPIKHKTNICFDCRKACGDCLWTEVDPNTNQIRYEPVPGWTAEKVKYYAGQSGKWKIITETYNITACPEFEPDPPRESSLLEMNDYSFERMLRRMGRTKFKRNR